jgi:hypothetical protein
MIDWRYLRFRIGLMREPREDNGQYAGSFWEEIHASGSHACLPPAMANGYSSRRWMSSQQSDDDRALALASPERRAADGVRFFVSVGQPVSETNMFLRGIRDSTPSV